MRKLISGVILGSMMLMTTCFGAGFTDVVENHWAKSAIDEMVERKIVSGYTDNTFRPKREISNIEMIIILSRTLGLQNDSEKAEEYLNQYTNTLSKYTTTYKKEVAYLLGKGVLNESDLEGLIGGTNANTPLKRIKMAVLLTKLFKEYDAVKDKSFVMLPFDDNTEIESSMKPFVEFVYNEKIMQGMNGNMFSPDTAVTRAQAAVMVVSVIPRLEELYKEEVVPDEPEEQEPIESIYEGKIVNFNKTQKYITISIDGNNEIFEYDSNTEIYLNDIKANDSVIKVGAEAKIQMLDADIVRIDIIREEIKEENKDKNDDKDNDKDDDIKLAEDLDEAYGEIISIVYYADEAALIIDDEDEGKITLIADDDTEYYMDDLKATLADFKVGDEVEIECEDGYINVIEKELKNDYLKVEGYLYDYDEDEYEVYVELENGAKITAYVEDAMIFDYIDEYDLDVDEMDELDDYLDELIYVFGEVDGDEIYATMVVVGVE